MWRWQPGSLRWDDLTTSHQLQLDGIFRPTVPQQDKGRKRCGACRLKTWNFVGTFSPVPGYTLTCPKFSLEGEPKGECNLPYQGPRLLEAVDHRLRELALALPAEASTSHTCPLLSGPPCTRSSCSEKFVLPLVPQCQVQVPLPHGLDPRPGAPTPCRPRQTRCGKPSFPNGQARHSRSLPQCDLTDRGSVVEPAHSGV